MGRKGRKGSSRLKPIIVVDRSYTDDPVLVQGVINPTDISLVLPARIEHWEKCVRVKMKDGERLVCVGTPTSFLGKTLMNPMGA